MPFSLCPLGGPLGTSKTMPSGEYARGQVLRAPGPRVTSAHIISGSCAITLGSPFPDPPLADRKKKRGGKGTSRRPWASSARRIRASRQEAPEGCAGHPSEFSKSMFIAFVLLFSRKLPEVSGDFRRFCKDKTSFL